MATYRIKRHQRRKLFGLGDTVGGAIDTAKNVTGATISGAGGLIGSQPSQMVSGGIGGLVGAGTVGTALSMPMGIMEGVGGAATGAGLGLLGGPLGAAIGGVIGGVGGAAKGVFDAYKMGGKLGYNAGSGLAKATGDGLQGIGNSLKTNA